MKRTALRRKTPLKRVGFKKKPLKKKKTKTPTIKKLKKIADRVFSEFKRRETANSSGLVRCYTCGHIYHWKDIQCGHYVRRSCMNLRYDTLNSFPQCYRCNICLKGNYPAYALNLLNDFGQGRLDYLSQQSKILKQWKPWELTDIINHYQQKIKELDEKK